MVKDTSKFTFNYIITIHNKESLIRQVLNGVIDCMSETSKIYTVLDGCTDNSEAIVDSIIAEKPSTNIYKVHTNDVHELLAINAGLKASDQVGNGFNIILQDDVILQDKQLEEKVIQLYQSHLNLGIVSFRHGGNISRSLIKKSRDISPLIDYTESTNGHGLKHAKALLIGSFTYREVAIKSPICIPFNVINEVGLPDEIFAPWDDLAYCYRVSSAGYNNGVYALEILSDISWGTTRTKKQESSISSIEKKNLALFKKLYRDQIINDKRRRFYDNKVYSYYSREQHSSFLKHLEYLLFKQKRLLKQAVVQVFSK